ncbi:MULTISPECIES: hypothetical protein [Salipiger]|uniref:hypothetical protein n=1 Tax=Salipiger TaxID=263377 RepID=UPI0010423811|nr:MULTISPECIES: hypothetical protein [Salipiger]MBN9885680.1 hypothetical protein [Salipiger abyssi]
MKNRNSEKTLPILLRYGTPRRNEPSMPGRYCDECEMWMVPTQAGERNAIDMHNSQLSLVTKTLTHTEQDDESLSMTNMLQTKTEANLEREDQALGALAASLQTKTDAGREADDTAEMLV